MSLIEYNDAIDQVEADIYHTASNSGTVEDFQVIQQRLDLIAELFKDEGHAGKYSYKLYELQALLHYYTGNDEKAIAFIHDAVSCRREWYPKAGEIEELILASKHKSTNNKKPNRLISSGLGLLNVTVSLITIGLSRAYPMPALVIGVVYFSIMIGITLTKRNAEKAREGDLKKLTSELRVYSIWLVFMVIILGLLIWQKDGFQPTTNKYAVLTSEERASTAVQQFKSSNTLPYVIDEITTITDVTSQGSVIQYHELIKGADTTAISENALRGIVQPGICANTSVKSLFMWGVSLQYLYTVYETGQLYSVTIQNSDCVSVTNNP